MTASRESRHSWVSSGSVSTSWVGRPRVDQRVRRLAAARSVAHGVLPLVLVVGPPVRRTRRRGRCSGAPGPSCSARPAVTQGIADTGRRTCAGASLRWTTRHEHRDRPGCTTERTGLGERDRGRRGAGHRQRGAAPRWASSRARSSRSSAGTRTATRTCGSPIEAVTGSELVDEDYDEVVDVVAAVVARGRRRPGRRARRRADLARRRRRHLAADPQGRSRRPRRARGHRRGRAHRRPVGHVERRRGQDWSGTRLVTPRSSRR